MIPKIIHQIWLGAIENKPQIIYKCEESVKKVALRNGYTYMLWNESNLPPIPLVKDLLRLKKYALCSDLIRLHVLYQYGGIYLDSDIEVLKTFDDLLEEKVFVGIYRSTLSAEILGNGVLGAEKKHPFIFENLLLETASMFTKIKPFYGVSVVNFCVYKMGLREYGEQRIGDVLILGKSKFYPKETEVREDGGEQSQAYTIHHDLHSWRGKGRIANFIKSLVFKTMRVLDIIRYFVNSPKRFRAMLVIAPVRKEYDKIGHYCRVAEEVNKTFSFDETQRT